jgi:hypothetical protein
LARVLIGIARPLYANEPFGVDLDETVCQPSLEMSPSLTH